MRGARVGPYVLLAEVGSGGMGTVWLSHDEEEDRAVAVKVLHPRLTEREGFFRRFRREAEAGMRVVDDHVVRTLDFGLHVAEGRTLCYLVTEFVEGRTLRALLAEMGAVPEALVREIARQTAAGLAAIHAAGVVHRDVKPDNVLITDDEQVRIMDLGVAKVLDASQALTREGQFAGSLAYAAPEQFGLRRDVAARGADGAAGDTIDARADLYSLGVMLHELVTGRNPLARETSAATVRAQLEEVPPDLAESAPDVSPVFAELVATLLAKRVEARLPTAGAVVDVLERGERSSWWAERREERRRRTSGIPRVPVRRETALRGRDGDLALLADVWEQAKAGRGSTVLVEGEAGIGKSRLLDAFLTTVVGGSDGGDAGGSVAIGGGVHALYGSHAPAGGLGALADAVLLRFGRARLEAALAPYLTATPALVPAFAALLRDEPPPAGAAALTRDALDAVFVHLLRGLAAERPLVWVVEDLHFASQDARRIVLSLARAVQGRRALLVVTSRPPVPEQEASRLASAGPFRRTALARLGPDDVAQLLRDAFRSERLVEKLAPRVAAKSDGVPFFVFETIQGLKAGQFVTELPDGTWVESKVIDRIEVPSAVRDLIAVRLAYVPTQVREVLDVASVQGYAFDPDVAAAALGRRPLAVLQALARLERRSGVVRAVDRLYRFDHHQIQEVLYADLPARLRDEYHAAIAEALERRAGAEAKDPAALDGALCVDLAEHFLAGGRGERALRYLDAALTHLERSYVNERAVALAERALAVPDLLAVGDRGRTLIRLAIRLDLVGRREPARVALESAVALARAEGDRQGEARATGNLGNVFRSLGRLAEAQEHYERHLALAREIGDRQGEAAATGNLGSVFKALGRLGEAREHSERHVALAREIGDLRGEAAATGNLGNLFKSLGRFAEAREHHERHVALAREIGDRQSEAIATGNLGLVLQALGQEVEAQARFERSLTLAREIGDRQAEARATGNLGNTLCSVGRFAEAQRHFERCLVLAREIGDRQVEARAEMSLGSVFHALGRLADAREHVGRGLALAREIGDRRGEITAAGNLGLVLERLGRRAEARAYLDRNLAMARESGDRRQEGHALAALAEAASDAGDASSAHRLGGEAREIRRSIGARADEAESLVVGGALHARCGRDEQARGELEAALAIARELALPAVELLASAHLCRLPGLDAAVALAAFAAHGARVEMRTAMEARLLLFRATADRAHLAEAKRLLAFLVEHAPEDCRESMLANVRLHREIAAAAAAADASSP